jgi:hypothetical protein
VLVLSRKIGESIFVEHENHWIKLELRAAGWGTGLVMVKYDIKYFTSNVAKNPVALDQSNRIWFGAPNGERLEVNFTWPRTKRGNLYGPRLGFDGPKSFTVTRGELL